MKLIATALLLLALCAAWAGAEPLTPSQRDVLLYASNLERGQLGISFHSIPLDEDVSLAYDTAGYEYGSGFNSEAERIIPARLFLVPASNRAKKAGVEAVKAFLAERLPKSDKFYRLLSAVREKPLKDGLSAFEISEFFPRTVLHYLGRGGEVMKGSSSLCSNCMGASKAFVTGEDVVYLDSPDFERFLANAEQAKQLRKAFVSDKPAFGEILYFPKLEHSAVYLFDGLIFQKSTMGVPHTYEIKRYEDMFDTINRTIVMYSNGSPAHSPTPSAWDIFTSSLYGAKPLAPPPSFRNETEVKRYSPGPCSQLLND